MSKDTPLLDELMARLSSFLEEERGRKAELARELDIPMSMLSNWLIRQKNPNGEYTLKIREWLKAKQIS